MISRVLRNAASLASAQIVMKFAGLVVTILIARSLHADGFGRFAAAWSFGMLVGVVADGGLAYYVAYEVARVPLTARRFVWTAIGLRGVISLVGLLVALALLPLLHFDPLSALAAVFFALSALLDGVTTQATAYYRAVARMHVEAQVVSFGRVFLLVATAGALVHPSVLSFAVAQAVASAATAALGLRRLCGDARPVWPRRRALAAVAAGALPFAASGLLTYVFFRIDTLLLRAFGVADAAVGAYSAAYRIMEAPRTAFGSIAAGVLPAATSLRHPSVRADFRKLAATTTGLVLWLVAPAVLVFALAPDTLIRLIFGHGFNDAGLLLMVLAPMPVLMALDAVLGSLLNALGGQTRITGVFAICAVVNVGLNVWLIPHFAALGAAIATVGTEVVELSCFAFLVGRRMGIGLPEVRGLLVAAVAGAGAATLVPSGLLSGLARIAAAVAVYGSVALVVQRRRLVVAA